MADTSPHKEEEEEGKEENLLVESAVHSNHRNTAVEAPLKEETIVDTVEERVPEPLEAERTPSPSIANHPQDESNNDDEIASPSSSKENLTTESLVPPDPAKNESLSDGHDVNPRKSPAGDKSERDPNDIEPEIKKVIIQGYTKDDAHKQQMIDPKKVPLKTLQKNSTGQPLATKSAGKISVTDPKRSFHYQKPTQAQPASKDAKQGTVSNGVAAAAAKRPTAPVRTLGTAEKKSTVPTKPTAASINAASKRLSTPVRPTTTERKPFTPSATTKRTPSSNPRATPKTPSTAPPRTMSATRPTLRSTAPKNENSTLATPTRNKKYENIQSKVNATSNYTPSPSNVKIFHQKPQFNVASKIGSLQNAQHTPSGGQVKIESRKLNFKENAKPKIDAKAEIQSPHVEKKILTQKLDWKASPKVGSLANAQHKPSGGNVKIFDQKLKIEAAPKVGSLDNANHKPAGGNVNIKEYKVPGHSSSNSVTSHSTGNSRRSSATRNRMPGSHDHDPLTPEEALGRN